MKPTKQALPSTYYHLSINGDKLTVYRVKGKGIEFWPIGMSAESRWWVSDLTLEQREGFLRKVAPVYHSMTEVIDRIYSLGLPLDKKSFLSKSVDAFIAANL